MLLHAGLGETYNLIAKSYLTRYLHDRAREKCQEALEVLLKYVLIFILHLCQAFTSLPRPDISAKPSHLCQPLTSLPSPRSSFGSIEDLRTGGCWFKPPARPVLLQKFDYSHCDRIHCSLLIVHWFDDDYVGKAASILH